MRRMLIILQLSLFMVELDVTLLLATPIATAAQALPGCQDRCGNLTIPYPFGIGPGCYLQPEFSITCNQSTQPPTAHLRTSNIIITNISLEEGELQILHYVAEDCYDAQGNQFGGIVRRLQVSPPYTISHTKNKFYALGCDTLAYFTGYRGDQRFTTGCMSICASLDVAVDEQDTCSGAGCCQVSIPRGLKNQTVMLTSSTNHTGIWDFNPCSYAFIVQAGRFDFSRTSLQLMNNTSLLPAVLNWEIGNQSCDAAQKSEGLACKGNSTCTNVGSAGYICKCMPGYHGNPYHPDGCRDIDECKNSNPCSIGTCINLLGNYSCKCPKGYKNDGMNEKTCIKDDNRSKTIILIISLGLGTGLGLLLLLISAWLGYRFLKKRNNMKRKEMFFKRNGGLLLEQQLSSGEVNVEKIKLFRSKELEKWTDNFNNDRILGQGGQGTVYKGMLADGRIVAVKKSKIVDESQLSDFINEVVILSQINHRNVVQLLGCCLETEVPILVYEFLPNGTLSQYIHEQNEEFPLTWEIRLRIAMEIAGALSYLHASASSPIYHRDIKSTNILMDAKYRVKIADFGTSRSISIDQTHLTTLVHGTFGYLDPEYFQSSQFTDKSDVYSFGVVLVELLTGQKPISFTRSQEEGKSLATYFINSMQLDRLFEILDTQVVKGGSKADIIVVANLARRCLYLNGRKRPTMREVTVELEGVQMAEKTCNGEQKYEDVEYVRTDSIEPWEIVSSSTGTGPVLDGDPASLLHEIPLLSFKSL